jgi:F0F1-type ATP synthase membrane subunit c/vacuolar-type H+-ATPase subunit K
MYVFIAMIAVCSVGIILQYFFVSLVSSVRSEKEERNKFFNKFIYYILIASSLSVIGMLIVTSLDYKNYSENFAKISKNTKFMDFKSYYDLYTQTKNDLEAISNSNIYQRSKITINYDNPTTNVLSVSQFDLPKLIVSESLTVETDAVKNKEIKINTEITPQSDAEILYIVQAIQETAKILKIPLNTKVDVKNIEDINLTDINLFNNINALINEFSEKIADFIETLNIFNKPLVATQILDEYRSLFNNVNSLHVNNSLSIMEKIQDLNKFFNPVVEGLKLFKKNQPISSFIEDLRNLSAQIAQNTQDINDITDFLNNKNFTIIKDSLIKNIGQSDFSNINKIITELNNKYIKFNENKKEVFSYFSNTTEDTLFKSIDAILNTFNIFNINSLKDLQDLENLLKSNKDSQSKLDNILNSTKQNYDQFMAKINNLIEGAKELNIEASLNISGQMMHILTNWDNFSKLLSQFKTLINPNDSQDSAEYVNKLADQIKNLNIMDSDLNKALPNLNNLLKKSSIPFACANLNESQIDTILQALKNNNTMAKNTISKILSDTDSNNKFINDNLKTLNQNKLEDLNNLVSSILNVISTMNLNNIDLALESSKNIADNIARTNLNFSKIKIANASQVISSIGINTNFKDKLNIYLQKNFNILSVLNDISSMKMILESHDINNGFNEFKNQINDIMQKGYFINQSLIDFYNELNAKNRSYINVKASLGSLLPGADSTKIISTYEAMTKTFIEHGYANSSSMENFLDDMLNDYNLKIQVLDVFHRQLQMLNMTEGNFVEFINDLHTSLNNENFSFRLFDDLLGFLSGFKAKTFQEILIEINNIYKAWNLSAVNKYEDIDWNNFSVLCNKIKEFDIDTINFKYAGLSAADANLKYAQDKAFFDDLINTSTSITNQYSITLPDLKNYLVLLDSILQSNNVTDVLISIRERQKNNDSFLDDIIYIYTSYNLTKNTSALKTFLLSFKNQLNLPATIFEDLDPITYIKILIEAHNNCSDDLWSLDFKTKLSLNDNFTNALKQYDNLMLKMDSQKIYYEDVASKMINNLRDINIYNSLFQGAGLGMLTGYAAFQDLLKRISLEELNNEIYIYSDAGDKKFLISSKYKSTFKIFKERVMYTDFISFINTFTDKVLSSTSVPVCTDEKNPFALSISAIQDSLKQMLNKLIQNQNINIVSFLQQVSTLWFYYFYNVNAKDFKDSSTISKLVNEIYTA